MSISHIGDSDHKNYHYSNLSCFINKTIANGENEVICGFNLTYYTNPGLWKCVVNVSDENGLITNATDNVTVNTLLAIGVDPEIDYGSVGPASVSIENTVNVTNYGNVKINLSLSGYSSYVGDGNAMNCSIGDTRNISVMYEKYNLTSSNSAANLLEFQAGNYTNLTGNVDVKIFNLDYRHNDLVNDVMNTTYWRIYVPPTVSGNCSGNIVFGAVVASGD